MEKVERDRAAKSDPYELGKSLFGRFSSEQEGLSVNRKALLKEKLRAKHSR